MEQHTQDIWRQTAVKAVCYGDWWMFNFWIFYIEHIELDIKFIYAGVAGLKTHLFPEFKLYTNRVLFIKLKFSKIIIIDILFYV